MVDTQGTAGSITASTGVTTLYTGLVSIPKGTLVTFNLGMPIAAASTGEFTGVAGNSIWIVGATSGTLYAYCFSGQTLSNTFVMTTTETINVRGANGSTVLAQGYTYFYQAVNP